jgi:hypothetical protein
LIAIQEVIEKSEVASESQEYELECDSSIIHIGLHKKGDQLFVALSLGDDKIHLFEASSDSYYSKRLQKNEILADGTVRGFFEEFDESKNEIKLIVILEDKDTKNIRFQELQGNECKKLDYSPEKNGAKFTQICAVKLSD